MGVDFRSDTVYHAVIGFQMEVGWIIFASFANNHYGASRSASLLFGSFGE